jgi:hypothetical protein
LNVSFKTVFSSFLSGKPLVNSLKWRPNKVWNRARIIWKEFKSQ